LNKKGKPKRKETRTVKVRKRRFNPGFVLRMVFESNSGSDGGVGGVSGGGSSGDSVISSAMLLITD
jgi:hypothetical protein